MRRSGNGRSLRYSIRPPEQNSTPQDWHRSFYFEGQPLAASGHEADIQAAKAKLPVSLHPLINQGLGKIFSNLIYAYFESMGLTPCRFQGQKFVLSEIVNASSGAADSLTFSIDITGLSLLLGDASGESKPVEYRMHYCMVGRLLEFATEKEATVEITAAKTNIPSFQSFIDQALPELITLTEKDPYLTEDTLSRWKEKKPRGIQALPFFIEHDLAVLSGYLASQASRWKSLVTGWEMVHGPLSQAQAYGVKKITEMRKKYEFFLNIQNRLNVFSSSLKKAGSFSKEHVEWLSIIVREIAITARHPVDQGFMINVFRRPQGWDHLHELIGRFKLPEFKEALTQLHGHARSPYLLFKSPNGKTEPVKDFEALYRFYQNSSCS